ncbi:hypothetical protein HPB50_027058 [Hyalomma asiaticum]|uniref:Uncharacterized protein n=1 Tax=Hyalomma asiaticum TaxID=266040 RepID=A0ACB7RT55_HYAAI|nr:hypothetical protein HPB50_027058 [Hyalomma asiaticum]
MAPLILLQGEDQRRLGDSDVDHEIYSRVQRSLSIRMTFAAIRATDVSRAAVPTSPPPDKRDRRRGAADRVRHKQAAVNLHARSDNTQCVQHAARHAANASPSRGLSKPRRTRPPSEAGQKGRLLAPKRGQFYAGNNEAEREKGTG